MAPDFWNDQENAKKIQRELGQLLDLIGVWETNFRDLEEAEMMLEMAVEERDQEVQKEVAASISLLKDRIDQVELECMFSGEHDLNNAMITIHAGAGGTEAQDWTSMLMRMYLRWAEEKGFATSILDYLPGDEAGVKSVTIMVKGRHAYGLLRSEVGIHRLVRISPFDASGRRHTSFASVMVMPELDESINIDINDKDLRIDTYRASGAGGQHVNTTDSAVRITHLPTGIMVVQAEKSQHQNRARAMQILRARLYDMERSKADEERSESRRLQVGSGDRSERIRTYNFPQGRVTDHRINLTLYKLDRVMQGDLDEIIDALISDHQSKLLAGVSEG